MLTIGPTGPLSDNTAGYSSTQGNSPMDWVKQGESAFSGGNMEEAKRCFEQALTRAPFDAKIHNNLSVVHWKRGETEEALHSLTRALELDPDDQDVIMNCSKVFRALGREQYAREVLDAYLTRHPWDSEARQELESMDRVQEQPRTQAESPDSAEFLNKQGEKQFERDKLSHAKACFEMAIEHDPQNAKAHSNLGVALWREGNLDQALQCFYRAMDLDSKDPDILYNSAKALTAAGEDETAADLLRLYLQQYPTDETAWEDLTQLLRRTASNGWQPTGLSGEVASIYLRMGRELTEAGDDMGAIQAFHRTLLLDQASAEPFFELGRIHVALGQDDDAAHFFREALMRDPVHKASLLALGRILIHRQAFSDARNLLEGYLAEYKDKDIEAALEEIPM